MDLNLENIDPESIECIEEIGSGSWGNVYKARCHIRQTINPSNLTDFKDFKSKNLESNNSNDITNQTTASNLTNQDFKCSKDAKDAIEVTIAIKAICARGDDLKENRNSKLIEKHVTREAYIHSLLNHVNIVKLYTAINNIELSGYFYFVMEYVPGQNLFDLHLLDNKLNDLQIADVLLQTATALEYCHFMYVIHRDVKLENILYNPSTNEVKLIDFGLACIFKTPLTPTKHGNCGTAEYQSYEMVCNIPYDERVDIWALGIVFFELLMGQTPFYAESFKQIETNIRELVIKRPYETPPTSYSDDQWNIIYGLLNRDRAKRISLVQLAMCLHYLKAKIEPSKTN